MFKRQTNKNVSKFLLISAQDIQWSRQQVLALLSQVSVMLISIVIFTTLLLSLGERRLQEDWAAKRYSELQTVGTLASDKVNFLQFRTQAFSKAELMNQYLSNPSELQKEKLLKNWDGLLTHIPELLGLSLFDPQGNPRLKTTNAFDNVALPTVVVNHDKTMGGNDIYSSQIQFVSINGKLIPYVYQLAWIENPDQSIRGYLVTYNSISEVLQTIKPAFFNHHSPLLLFGSQGMLYAGASQEQPLKKIPTTLGSSIQQTYPELWQQMANTNFGQYHNELGTFVFLKVELAANNSAIREYYLMSYIRHEDIAARFEQWRYILIFFGVLIGSLATALLYTRHRYQLEKNANVNSINLASSLFRNQQSCLIVNSSGRVLKANRQAAKTLSVEIEALLERRLQRVLQLEDDVYQSLTDAMENGKHWQEIVSIDEDSCTITVSAQPGKTQLKSERYWVVTFENITELTSAKQQGYFYQLLSESNVATALTDTNGQLLKFNHKFKKLLDIEADSQDNVMELLGKEFSQQWADINSRLSLQGKWKGQIFADADTRFANSLKASIQAEHNIDGEIEYLVVTLQILKLQKSLQQLPSQQAPLSSMVVPLSELEVHFSTLTEPNREQTCLLIMDINPEGLISHISDIDHLEKRQKDIEMQLLIDLPIGFQIAHWRLGSLVILLTSSDSVQAHKYAMSIMDRLEQNELNEGINIGIAGYPEPQSFEHYLSNAEVALKRAKQTGNQNICQAFTRKA
ncbi:PAS fold protein [Shewanella sp. P1-14-1]|uniref:PAS domain-containing protein n=1 Tax=Shewanella sp. P1-14-1 TaxID=1723761 RepID=UPI0006D66445|nr:PAS domain-containing protein [Shewanella sp. P1-14-1]KPZ69779.1 PAS fold protein [Shewanella sp. P1-14-1]